ncbi:conserved hypothetical protein [metagenome]|uniref:Uncharacterized protein n=1 Tax=metagenome TaxID=256318 RepID=A0A2P2CCD1_9ZZZZ
MSEINEWFAGRLPDEWFDGAPQITVDREEILVVGTLPHEEGEISASEADGRIQRHREETRAARMTIADEAEARFGRKVAWGASLGDRSYVFTSLAVPVMTRLRQPERLVLDTLVDAGVARSRSEALAWCVKLVGRNEEAWIKQLRDALDVVATARGEGPTSR